MTAFYFVAKLCLFSVLNSTILKTVVAFTTTAYRCRSCWQSRRIDSASTVSPILLAKKTWTPPSEEANLNNFLSAKSKSIQSNSTTVAVTDTVSASPFDQGLYYELDLVPCVSGISWGSDISFRYVFIRDIEPVGEAYGLVQKGDFIISIGNVSTIEKDFNFVLDTISKVEGDQLTLKFFRGTRQQMMGKPVPFSGKELALVTVKEQNKPDVLLKCPPGTNLRNLLVENGINVYRSITR